MSQPRKLKKKKCMKKFHFYRVVLSTAHFSFHFTSILHFDFPRYKITLSKQATPIFLEDTTQTRMNTFIIFEQNRSISSLTPHQSNSLYAIITWQRWVKKKTLANETQSANQGRNQRKMSQGSWDSAYVTQSLYVTKGGFHV